LELEQLKLTVQGLMAQVNTALPSTSVANTTTTINTVNNTVVNISLRNFNQENMDAVSDDFLDDAFLFVRLRNLTSTLHYNPRYPENHNIRLKSHKRKQAEVFRNNQWEVVPLDTAAGALLQQSARLAWSYGKNNRDALIDDDSIAEDEYLSNMQQLHRLEKYDGKQRDPEARPHLEDFVALMSEKQHALTVCAPQ
jgi:hypothetical protein